MLLVFGQVTTFIIFANDKIDSGIMFRITFIKSNIRIYIFLELKSIRSIFSFGRIFYSLC